jgi:hypothetical protein
MNEGGRTEAKKENAKGVWARMKTTEVEDRSRSWNRKRSLRRGLAENGGFSEVPTSTSHTALSVMRNHVPKSIRRRDDRPDRALPFLFRSKGPFPTRLSFRSELL